METKIEGTTGCFAALVTGIVGAAAGIYVNGWVLKQLWGWFIVDTFDAPALSLRIAIGISIIVTYIIYDSTISRNEHNGTWEELFRGLGRTLISPAMYYIFGYIIYHI